MFFFGIRPPSLAVACTVCLFSQGSPCSRNSRSGTQQWPQGGGKCLKWFTLVDVQALIFPVESNYVSQDLMHMGYLFTIQPSFLVSRFLGLQATTNFASAGNPRADRNRLPRYGICTDAGSELS